MTIRQEALPELTDAWQSLARDAAANLAIQLGIADDGGFRTAADTTRDLGYRDQDYAVYAAAERKAGRVPQAMTAWRPILPYGTSYHNYGAARDAVIISRPAGMSYSDAVNAVRAIAGRNGLQGISSANDPLHFQLPITLTDAQNRWADYTSGGGDSGAGGDDSSSDNPGLDDGMATTPAGNTVLAVLLGVVILGGAYLVVRRLSS